MLSSLSLFTYTYLLSNLYMHETTHTYTTLASSIEPDDGAVK